MSPLSECCYRAHRLPHSGQAILNVIAGALQSLLDLRQQRYIFFAHDKPYFAPKVEIDAIPTDDTITIARSVPFSNTTLRVPD